VTAGPQQIYPYVCIPGRERPWLHIDAFASGYATGAFGPWVNKQQNTTTAEVCDK